MPDTNCLRCLHSNDWHRLTLTERGVWQIVCRMEGCTCQWLEQERDREVMHREARLLVMAAWCCEARVPGEFFERLEACR